jgi:hypothetical protein
MVGDGGGLNGLQVFSCAMGKEGKRRRPSDALFSHVEEVVGGITTRRREANGGGGCLP